MKKGLLSIQILVVFIVISFIALISTAALYRYSKDTAVKDINLVNSQVNRMNLQLDIKQIYAEDGLDETLENFFFLVSAQSGSDAIVAKNIVFVVDDVTSSTEVTYDGTVDCDNSTSLSLKPLTFGVQHLKSTDSSSIAVGDLVLLCFNLNKSYSFDDYLKFSISILDSRVQTIERELPSTIQNKRIYIYEKHFDK